MENRIINYITLWSCTILMYINDGNTKYMFIAITLIMLIKTFYDNMKKQLSICIIEDKVSG